MARWTDSSRSGEMPSSPGSGAPSITSGGGAPLAESSWYAAR